MKITRLMSVLALALAQLACGGAGAPESLAVQGQASVVPPNYNCATVTFYLGRSFGEASFLIGDPVGGTYGPMDAAGDTVTIASPDGIVWSWSSTALVRAVFIRADAIGTPLGNATNQLWLYASPAGGGSYSGAGIYTEDNTNERYPAKEIEFCFDPPPPPPEYQLEVTKTAEMSYDKTYEWYVRKSSAVPELLLAVGQTFLVPYTVEAGVAAIGASNFEAAGQIVIHNPAPIAATITEIVDAMGDVTPVVDCGVTFPYELAAGATLTCDWSADLPDGSDRGNHVAVNTVGDVLGDETSAFAGGATARVTEIDACATFTDDAAGVLGTVCADAAPVTFEYSLSIGPFEACGAHEFTNVASFVTNDTAAAGSSSVTIPITVPCEGGCTLTPGYWKTHSAYGPAPYDETWALLPAGEDSAFFLSGLSWYRQFLVPPAGNAYFQLSHAYAAAALNGLNGASLDAVGDALAAAEALLGRYTPAQVAAMKGADRARFVSTASALDAFNNGVTGPGHCDE